MILEPRQRLVAMGSDPSAHAVAAMGRGLGWEMTRIERPGTAGPPSRSLAVGDLDRRTVVAVTLYDAEAEFVAWAPVHRSDARYVGAMGSRSRLAERRKRLQAGGLDPWNIARLSTPSRLAHGGRSPGEVAVEIVEASHRRDVRAVRPVPAGLAAGRRRGVAR